jgi:hypothetical protein
LKPQGIIKIDKRQLIFRIIQRRHFEVTKGIAILQTICPGAAYYDIYTREEDYTTCIAPSSRAASLEAVILVGPEKGIAKQR